MSPAAEHIAAYGTFWLGLMNQIGPGENTADANRLPRALRHPYLTVGPDSSLSFTQLRQLTDQFTEITGIAYSGVGVGTQPSVPTVPASVDLPPNILRLTQLGFYKA